MRAYGTQSHATADHQHGQKLGHCRQEFESLLLGAECRPHIWLAVALAVSWLGALQDVAGVAAQFRSLRHVVA